jgi:hypothetical protein
MSWTRFILELVSAPAALSLFVPAATPYLGRSMPMGVRAAGGRHLSCTAAEWSSGPVRSIIRAALPVLLRRVEGCDEGVHSVPHIAVGEGLVAPERGEKSCGRIVNLASTDVFCSAPDEILSPCGEKWAYA